MKPRQFLSAPFKLAAPGADAASANAREFTGTAAVYGNLFYRWSRESYELVATILDPGCFSASLAEINARQGARAGRVPLFWEHYQLIGRSLTLEDASDGLNTSFRVAADPAFDSFVALIREGAADGMSVGFEILASTKIKDAATSGEEVEHVTSAELGEITVCVWGANPLALVDAAASASMGRHERLAGKVLSAANLRDLECITSDAARIKARAEKEEEKKDDDGEGASKSVAFLSRQIEWLHLRIDTLEAASGRRKE